MRFETKVKQWIVVLLCVLMAAGIMAQGAIAAYPSGKCTNMNSEGIEYVSEVSIKGDDANDWRVDLTPSATITGTTKTAGEIVGIEVSVTNDNTRYQCTETDPKEFSCNSMPANSIIKTVYLLFKPDTSITEGTNVHFTIKQSSPSPDGKVLLSTDGVLEIPSAPCARNIITKDFVSVDGQALIFNTDSSCSEHSTVEFEEKEPQFAMVNIMNGNYLNQERFRIVVNPQPKFKYTLELEFEGPDPTTPDPKDTLNYKINCKHQKEDDTEFDISTDCDFSSIDGLGNTYLPLTLLSGNISGFDTKYKDLTGHKDYPSSFDFDILFWYENTEGTLGYENSIFHFERNMTVQFGPYCTSDRSNVVLTAPAKELYDPCKSSEQVFTASLIDDKGKGLRIAGSTSYCSSLPYCTSLANVTVKSSEPEKTTKYYFATRKCADSSCTYVSATDAYPYSLTVSDGNTNSRTYKYSSHSAHTTTIFKMKVFQNAAQNKRFALTGVRLSAKEPGTYVIYGFLNPDDIKKNDLSKYAVKFYVTVNEKDELTTCSTLANNGYFRGYWNDCLSHSETQLIPFEHIDGTEEAWIENRSSKGIHFPFVAEYSYLPQKLEVASLRCRFKALSGGGKPKEGYCTPDDVYVPPNTKVTITGGTFYLEASPTVDEYYVAYMREETMNISHLFFTVTVRSCDRKIPDTGISLRSPLKISSKVNEATSYVFTGNSLRIPAIGLGMETPIPIVHVYYQDGSPENGWDLSTLGNYVGELEGGSYLPYAGNSALTGHYYSQGVFKNLEHLNMGDEIIVFANDGFKYIYHVVEKFITQPNDIYQMFQQVGERSLTLVTCENYNLVTDEYERRQMVRAVIDSIEPYEVNW